MTFTEIYEFLTMHEMGDVQSRLREAVHEEADILHQMRGQMSGYHMPDRAEAETLYAADITAAMAGDGKLDPYSVLAHRDRYMTAWAIAQLIVAKQRELAPPAVPEAEVDATDNFIKLCEANAELGVMTVELLRKLDAKDQVIEQLRAQVADLQSPPMPIGIPTIDAQIQQLTSDVTTLAKNLIWLASTVHQNHHHDPYTQGTTPETADWRRCMHGTCASMDHMLGQVGLDKNLATVPRRP